MTRRYYSERMGIVVKISWNNQYDIVASIPLTIEYKMQVMLKMEHALDVSIMVWYLQPSRTIKQYLPPFLFLSHANSTSLRLNSVS